MRSDEGRWSYTGDICACAPGDGESEQSSARSAPVDRAALHAGSPSSRFCFSPPPRSASSPAGAPSSSPRATAAPAWTPAPTTDASADAPAIPFCSTIDAGFCSDFDQEPLPENWHLVSASGGATGAEDSDASVSPPNSYLAIAPAVAAADSGAPTTSAILTSPALAEGAESHRVRRPDRRDQLPRHERARARRSSSPPTHKGRATRSRSSSTPPPRTGPRSAPRCSSSRRSPGPRPRGVDELPGLFAEVGAWYHVTLDFGIDTADAGVVARRRSASGSAVQRPRPSPCFSWRRSMPSAGRGTSRSAPRRRRRQGKRRFASTTSPTRTERVRLYLGADASAARSTSRSGTAWARAAAMHASNSGFTCGGPNGPSAIFTGMGPYGVSTWTIRRGRSTRETP